MAWLRAPATAYPAQRSGGQLDRWRAVGAVAPPVALDGGGDQIPGARLADPFGNTAKSVLFTWVFLNTRGSLLLAILLHAATNLFRVSPGSTSPGDFTLPLLAAGGKWLLVVIMLVASGPSLVRGPRPEALYNRTGNGRVGGVD